MGGKDRTGDPNGNRAREELSLNVAGDGQVALDPFLSAHTLESA